MFAIVSAGVPLGITFIIPFSAPTLRAPVVAAFKPASAPLVIAVSTTSSASISSPFHNFWATSNPTPIAAP